MEIDEEGDNISIWNTEVTTLHRNNKTVDLHCLCKLNYVAEYCRHTAAQWVRLCGRCQVSRGLLRLEPKAPTSHSDLLCYLWVEVEPLQRVDDQRVLGQPVIHDHVEAVQERRSLDDGLVVGVVQTLGRDTDTHLIRPKSEDQQEQQTLAAEMGQTLNKPRPSSDRWSSAGSADGYSSQPMWETQQGWGGKHTWRHCNLLCHQPVKMDHTACYMSATLTQTWGQG